MAGPGHGPAGGDPRPRRVRDRRGRVGRGELLREPAVRAYRKHLTARGHRPTADVRMAEMGGEAGIVGAADLARRR